MVMENSWKVHGKKIAKSVGALVRYVEYAPNRGDASTVGYKPPPSQPVPPTSFSPSDLADWVYVVNIIYMVNMMLHERSVEYFFFQMSWSFFPSI